jgi:hypothetical protein
MKGCSSQPQDMTVWPGLQLIGGGRSSRRVLNGVVYIVRGFTDDTLQVVAHADFREGDEEVIELSLQEAAENLRLSILKKTKTKPHPSWPTWPT